jgi:uncharacterized membrane protein
MKAFLAFVKTTLIGGVLIVLPLWLSPLLVLKLVGHLKGIVAPISARLPARLDFPVALFFFNAGVEVRQLLFIVAIFVMVAVASRLRYFAVL